MSKSEFLQLAHKYDPAKHFIHSYYMSEKVDGIRCLWDGGISRGLSCDEVPWANVAKHARYVIPPRATGLWTRYGQPIQAPDWWLDDLPSSALDGELTMGRGTWQELSSCVKSLNPDSNWERVNYLVFDIPSLHTVFQNRVINTTNYKKTFTGIMIWVSNRINVHKFETHIWNPNMPFYKRQEVIRLTLKDGRVAKALPQIQLGIGPVAKEAIDRELDRVEADGGEGVMLRSPISLWNPIRTYDLLKVKRLHDMEGTVVGYKWAKPTDLGRSLTGTSTNKILGLMGSLRLRLPNDKEFDLSGFTDSEREMTWNSIGENIPVSEQLAQARIEGQNHPGEVVSEKYYNSKFPIGTSVTFQYRELSVDGIPKEGRYLRKLKLD